MGMNQRAEKARQLRYRRAALAIIQRERLDDELHNIAGECCDLEWSVEDDETLLDVFDGDTDEIQEFRMMFADLSAKCEQLQYQLHDGYVTEHFDDFFVSALGSPYNMVGYDFMEEDYISLTRYEAELAQSVSGKRLMALTKEKLIAIAGQCFGVMMCFLDIRHSYDCLKATFDALRDDRAELLKSVRTLEDVYNKWQEDPYDRWLRSEYEELLSHLPERAWIE